MFCILLCQGISYTLATDLSNDNWIKLESAVEIKGEVEQCSNPAESCLPDIHSWTAETWAMKRNITHEEKSTGPDIKTAEGKELLMTFAHDTLMKQIAKEQSRNQKFHAETRIMTMTGREARGSKGGMGSMESALITISLLTFAVYLIKLVMKLINAVQAKKDHHSTVDPVDSIRPIGVQTFVVRPARHSGYESIAEQWLQTQYSRSNTSSISPISPYNLL